MNLPEQLTTFWVDSNLFGIDVQVVQEVTKGMALTPVPLAPPAIAGLLNLRGQIASVISLRKLFALEDSAGEESARNFVICRFDGVLIALLVDGIGDVIQVHHDHFEPMPQSISENIRLYSDGVFKLEATVLTLLNIQKVLEKINKNKEK